MPTNLDVEFLRAVVESVAHPIFVKDRAFRFVLVNDAMCESLGHPRASFLGRTDYDLFAKAEADFFRQKDEEMFASGETVVIDEEPITDAHGGVHVLATTKVPLRNAQGEMTHLVGIIHDITALKDVEERLVRANEELETRVAQRTAQLHEAQAELLRAERLAVLGQLAGGVAHQLRNPLSALINAASILRRQSVDPAVRDIAEIVEAESWRANQIVDDLLAYARIRSPSREDVPLDEILSGVLDSIRRSSVAIEHRPSPGLSVHVDPHQLSEAIRNLVSNAMEAAEPRGAVRVDAVASGPAAVIRITDDGPGIDGEHKKRLFEPLFTTKAYGLGLGLTTAKSLIENQGGTLRCASTGPDGTTFEVEVPLSNE
ncbi:MAG: nitrogen regulation protein NR(II) [Sandaracinaceae bacterium]